MTTIRIIKLPNSFYSDFRKRLMKLDPSEPIPNIGDVFVRKGQTYVVTSVDKTASSTNIRFEKIVTVKAGAYLNYAFCENCSSHARLEFKSIVIEDGVEKYIHECINCKSIDKLDRVYPMTEYIPLDNK